MAAEWGWSETAVMAAAAAGHFKLEKRELLGTPILTISAEDKRRLEAMSHEEAKPRDLRSDARQSYVELLAASMAEWYGSDPAILLKPYERAQAVERFAAIGAIPLSRGTKTYADILSAAGKMLEQCGYVARPKEDKEQDKAA